MKVERNGSKVEGKVLEDVYRNGWKVEKVLEEVEKNGRKIKSKVLEEVERNGGDCHGIAYEAERKRGET